MLNCLKIAQLTCAKEVPGPDEDKKVLIVVAKRAVERLPVFKGDSFARHRRDHSN